MPVRRFGSKLRSLLIHAGFPPYLLLLRKSFAFIINITAISYRYFDSIIKTLIRKLAAPGRISIILKTESMLRIRIIILVGWWASALVMFHSFNFDWCQQEVSGMIFNLWLHQMPLLEETSWNMRLVFLIETSYRKITFLDSYIDDGYFA